MHCKNAGEISRLIDGDLPPREAEQLRLHLADCPACAREMRLLSIPRRVGRSLPVLQASPFFYSRLRAALAAEARQSGVWQVVPLLSRRIVPILAAITFALLSVFFYSQIAATETDVYQAYERIYLPADASQQLVIAEQSEISDDALLRSLADEPAAAPPNGSLAPAVK